MSPASFAIILHSTFSHRKLDIFRKCLSNNHLSLKTVQRNQNCISNKKSIKLFKPRNAVTFSYSNTLFCHRLVTPFTYSKVSSMERNEIIKDSDTGLECLVQGALFKTRTKFLYTFFFFFFSCLLHNLGNYL